MPSLLFITSTRIGDAVLSSGALAYAQTLVPGADVTIACGALPAPLFRAAPGLARLIALQKRDSDSHWYKLIRDLRRERYDLAVDLRGTLVTMALAAKRRIVYRKNARIRHKVEEIAALMGAPKPLSPKLHLDAKARADAAAAFPEPGPLLALGFGANVLGKRWRADRFAAVARRLTSASGALPNAHVALLGAAEDAAIGREIVESLDGLSARDLSGELDLPASAALLERATLFIGNDSGLMHIAAAAGAPTLGLFGATDERIYGPWGARARALRGRPREEIVARKPSLSTDWTLMDDLTIEAVENAASELLRAGGLA